MSPADPYVNGAYDESSRRYPRDEQLTIAQERREQPRGPGDGDVQGAQKEPELLPLEVDPTAASPEVHVLRLLRALGHDTDREGLRDTPRRVVAFLREFCTPHPFKFTTFDNDGHTDEMVVQAGITFNSLCEHHMLPFIGTASVAYVPGRRIVGLSKLARAVRYCAAGLQNQERITRQVADMLMAELEPQGVAVLLRAEHTCMTVRGVQAPGTLTTSSCLIGCFKEDARCRAEFLTLAGVR